MPNLKHYPWACKNAAEAQPPTLCLLRVLLWGKEIGKGRELHSELVTNGKLQGWKFGQAKTLTQDHMKLGTSSKTL